MKLESKLIAFAALTLGLSGCATAPPVADSAMAPETPVEPAPMIENDRAIENTPVLDENAALQDYLACAALNNTGLEAAFHRWRAAMEKIQGAGALPDPRLNYGYFIRSVETRAGPQQHRIGVAQMFPWFGKRALRGDVATQEAHALYQEFESAKLKLFYEVKHSWCELHYLHRAIEITGSNIRLLRDLESVAQTKVRGGSGLSGVSKAQVELGKLEDRNRTLIDLRGPITARLNAALNRPAGAAISWPDKIEVSRRPVDAERLLDWLAEANPELRALKHRISKDRKAVRLARKDYFPDLTLGVDYAQTDGRTTPGLPDDGKDPLMAMVSINIPLWRKKYDAALRSAESSRDASEALLRNRASLLQADLKMAVYQFQDAERKIDLYRDTLTPLAEQSLQMAQQSWEAGKADFLNLIDAERLLLEFQLQFERAKVNREQRLAEIEMLVGRELPDGPAGDSPTDSNSEPRQSP